MVMSLIESLTRIKSAVYGREVREAIHDGVFRANQIADGADAKADNTQIRQDAVEDFNNQVIQEMTDKDVISAPELIDARKGEVKLSARLDKDYNEVTAQLAQTTKVYPTVADMILRHTASEGAAVTLGYHSISDGGGSLYTVLSHPEKSYDIEGIDLAFRPIVTGTIHPKMFGTINDGTSLDNEGLQACYDYAFDHGIERIDGLGLLYTVGSINTYDAPARGWAHTGAMCKSGRTLVNFRFRTADGSTAGTCPLTIDMTDGPVVLENIEIDGNRSNLSDIPAGREDGGCHGIHFHHRDAVPDEYLVDFLNCGDIHMKNCKVKDIYSYGVRIDALDCYMLVENCNFDVYGIAVQAHTTRFEVRGGVVKVGIPRVGMVPDAFQEEIEFGDNYQGTKTQSILIKNVKAYFLATQSLFKIHYGTMGGASWESIDIVDCYVSGGSHLSIYNHKLKKLSVDSLSIKNPTSDGSLDFINISSGDNVGLVSIINLDIENKRNSEGHTKLTKTEITNFTMKDVAFSGAGRLFCNSDKIETLKIIGASSGELDAYGVLRNLSTAVDTLIVADSNFTDFDLDDFSLFEANIKKIMVTNSEFTPNTAGAHGRCFFSWNPDRIEFLGRDILLRGSSYHPVSQSFLVTEAADGYVNLNNVRHLTGPTKPKVQANKLNVSRVIYTNCENLY